MIPENTGPNLSGSNSESGLLFGLIESYGGLYFLLKIIDRLFSVLKIKNRKVTNIIKYSISTIIFIFDLFKKIKSYNNKNKSVENNTRDIVSKIFKTDEAYRFGHDFTAKIINNEVIKWLLKSPTGLKNFELLSYYDSSFKKNENTGDLKKINIHLIQRKNKCIQLFLCISKTSDIYRIDQVYSSCDNYSDQIEFASSDIIGEFTKSIIGDNKTLIYKDLSISSVSKISNPNIVLNDINYTNIKKEIEFSLKNKIKRSFLFVGGYGNGKSSIIDKLESEINYPFINIYKSCDYFGNDSSLKLPIDLLKTISPCVVRLEDIEGLNIDSKKKGGFSELINTIDKNINIVYLMSINNTDEADGSFLRTGRVDTVVEITNPSDINVMYKIMNNRYNSLKGSDNDIAKFIDFDGVNEKNNTLMLDSNLTRSDFNEIANKVFLIHNTTSDTNLILKKIDNNILTKAIELVINAKKTIEKYKRSKNNE